ncbi:CDP-diacylglycerol--glycerol-3-phosphate 3-phosphatidyltransferase [Verrucomicrobiota bacterium]
MNLPNKLTVSRLYMTALMVFFLSVHIQYSYLVAFLLFVLAAITDWLDGHLARTKYGVSDFGKLMDPLADKVLTSAAFIAFVQLGMVPAWFAVIIVTREFMVTGLRLLVAGRGTVMPAGIWGKLKTIFQMIAISLGLLILGLGDCGVESNAIAEFITGSIMWLAMIFTVVSGVEYFWKYREEFMHGA